MSKNGKDRRPYLPPVQRIELSEKNIKQRWLLIVVLLSIGVVALAMGIKSMLETEPGWQQVEVSSSNLNCSRDFVLMYEFGTEGIPATAEYRDVAAMYTQLTELAYTIFSAETESAEVNNLYYLNQNVNETVSVAHELYKALEWMVHYDSRYPFLAPAVSRYGSVFLSATDAEAALYDPARNPELSEDIQKLAAFSSDKSMIWVEVLGNDQVRLNVAQEYLDFAQENGIGVFLDFGWMKNAFITDYMADTLAASGYTNGYLASFDGFTRNLDDRGNRYSFNLFDRWEDTISIPAALYYDQPVSIAYLRNYPLSEEDQWSYYAYADGSVTSVMLDLTDGMSRSSTDNLVSYSYEKSCAELALEMAPVFIAEELDEAALNALEEKGIHSIWFVDNTLHHTDAGAELAFLPESGGADYVLNGSE